MTLDGIAGRLVLRPGSADPVLCERPMVGSTLLNKLTAGRRAVLLPDLLGAVFTLCSHAQRATARRAVRAALGIAGTNGDACSGQAATQAEALEARSVVLHVVREHLQRLALDLPALAGQAAVGGTPQWLADSPVLALPTSGRSRQDEAQALDTVVKALPGWLECRLFGMAPERWLEAWRRDGARWLAAWCEQQAAAPTARPVARALLALRGPAQAVAWPCRALAPLAGDAAEARHEMQTLALALSRTPRYAERPHWYGAAAETGPWTRRGESWSVHSAWDRLGARLADVACIALEPDSASAQGALCIAPGEGIAWTEMARGLLVHWVQLEDGPRDAETARIARCHVLAPTEWNFHPEGGLANWLRAAERTAVEVALAAAALDPCLPFTLETPHATPATEARHA